jgi:hypothetical protein
MMPLGQLILWLICFGLAPELAGAALFAPFAKGAGFDIAFPPKTLSPKKASVRDYAKTGRSASRILHPVVPCYEWRIFT